MIKIYKKTLGAYDRFYILFDKLVMIIIKSITLKEFKWNVDVFSNPLQLEIDMYDLQQYSK